jgi:hypothetical protein
MGRAVGIVEVRAAEGTESAISVMAGAEVMVMLIAWEVGAEVATGVVDLLEEPDGDAEPEPEVELPVAG